ncbi:MAG: NAD(P)H-hydrate epimerase, partial [Bacteroidales bacterium]|nr:NAD(P)H-hydrate epimerase [Bacteroidales bacterium]
MKILPAEQIREADAYTIRHEPIADIDLMERAARKCFDWLYQHVPSSQSIHVVAGTGNNGGDGLAIARMLNESGYKVKVWLTGTPENCSPGCKINYDRLPDNLLPTPISEEKLDLDLADGDIVIDALFGSGLTRPVTGFHEDLIKLVNKFKKTVIAIDVPSGLFIDQTVKDQKDPAVIHASYTLTFAPPKLAFFFPENDPYIGEWVLLDIGLSEAFLAQVKMKNFMITAASVKPLLRKRNKFAHKGTFGHSLLICGEKGKMGAAVLAAKACLRSGSGLVTVRVPGSGVNILQTAVPEAMLAID